MVRSSKCTRRNSTCTLLIFLAFLLSPLGPASQINKCFAAEPPAIPTGASDSEVCGIVQREYDRGLDLWRANDLTGTLKHFEFCEEVMKRRGLWAPPKLPKNSSIGQMRAHFMTNSVIISLAAIHQKMEHRSESERYARLARERGILPHVVMSGSRR